MVRITILALVALVAPVPARGQTGILHKHRSIAAPALPVSALPAASATTAPASTATAPAPVVCEVPPGTVTGADGLTVTTPSTTTSGAVGGWCNVVPGHVGDGASAPPVVSLPSPIDGDGTVHIMPYPYVPRQIAPIDGDGIVHALPYPAIKPTSADGLPVGIEVASQMVAPQAFGLERAKVATTGFGGSLTSARRAPLPASLPAASGRTAGPATPAAGARSGEGVVEARSAAPAAIQPVGQPTATPAPRWRDRLRFSWPGSRN